jgi:hypothetical protein
MVSSYCYLKSLIRSTTWPCLSFKGRLLHSSVEHPVRGHSAEFLSKWGCISLAFFRAGRGQKGQTAPLPRLFGELANVFVSFCPFLLSKYRLWLLAVSGAGPRVANLYLKALSSPRKDQPKLVACRDPQGVLIVLRLPWNQQRELHTQDEVAGSREGHWITLWSLLICRQSKAALETRTIHQLNSQVKVASPCWVKGMGSFP